MTPKVVSALRPSLSETPTLNNSLVLHYSFLNHKFETINRFFSKLL